MSEANWVSYTNYRGESAIIYSHQWSIGATVTDDAGVELVIVETDTGPRWAVNSSDDQ